MMRRTVALVLTGVIAAGVTGCGKSENDKEGNDVATLSGNCALYPDKYQVSPITADLLEKTLGDGDWKVAGDVSGSGAAGDPVNGQCRYTGPVSEGRRTVRLDVSVTEKSLPTGDYAAAMNTMRTNPDAKPIAGVEGYTLVQSADAAFGGRGEAGVGVIFDGDRMYGVKIVVPSKGVDGTQACEELVKAAATVFSQPLQSK